MRSVKRPQKPVHRYRSLVSPGIAVLAVLLFYAVFVPSGKKGETARFERDGLSLEITGVHHIGGSAENFDPERGINEPYDTYYVYPGSRLTVLEGSGRWELRRQDGETLGLTEGIAPVRLTEDFDSAYVWDLEKELTLLSVNVSNETEYWK